MLIVGLVLLVAAAVAVVVGLVQRRRWHQLMLAEPRTAAQLREEAATVGELGGAGVTRVCEVTGTAQPGPDGPLTANVSNVACVWHRQVVRRRYVRTRTDSNGSRRQERRTEVVSDISSSLPFTVVDETGAVVVAPDGATVDRPERVHKDYRQDSTGASVSAFGLTLRLGSNDGTIGFETEEWVIRPGTPVYVLGEASGGGTASNQAGGSGGVRVAKPGQGRFLISTRSKAELTASTRRKQQVSMVIGAVALLAGLAALVASLL